MIELSVWCCPATYLGLQNRIFVVARATKNIAVVLLEISTI